MTPTPIQENRMPDSSHERKVILTPLKPALIAGVAQRLPVLVRVHSPDPEPGEIKARKPYGLALVIDRSGSMSGEPLREAVRCARHIVGRLAPVDTAALVAFDDKVRTLVPAGPVGDGSHLRQALATIHEGGTTNLHGGWKNGADGLTSLAAEAAIARVTVDDCSVRTGLLDGLGTRVHFQVQLSVLESSFIVVDGCSVHRVVYADRAV